MTDDLVSRARGGDADAWRELYRAHAGRLVVWLRSRPSGDAAASAEDLAAETWLVAASRIGEFRGSEGAQFAGWLFAIARNIAATTHRRTVRRRTDPFGDPVEPDAGDDALTHGFDVEVAGRDWVRNALALLPPRERDVVACVDGLGLDVASTAQALGISAVAVRVAHHRGLRRLRAGAGPVTGPVPEV